MRAVPSAVTTTRTTPSSALAFVVRGGFSFCSFVLSHFELLNSDVLRQTHTIHGRTRQLPGISRTGQIYWQYSRTSLGLLSKITNRSGLASISLLTWKATGFPPYIKVGRRCLYDWPSVQGALLRRQRGGRRAARFRRRRAGSPPNGRRKGLQGFVRTVRAFQ